MNNYNASTIEIESLGAAFSAWGGKFRLLCSICYTEVRCDIKAGGYLNQETRSKAAQKFIDMGWRFNKKPLCPKCSKNINENT